MQVELEERVPRGGSSLMTVFGIPGGVLGLLAWLISDLVGPLDADEMWAASLILGIVFGGITYAMSVLRGRVLPAALAGGVMGIVTAALFRLSSVGEVSLYADDALAVLANIGLVIVALPFLRAWLKGSSPFDYRPLYADAWNIPAIVGVAQVFVLAGTALAALVAALFNFIGLGFLRELMTEGWFIGAYAGLLQGVAIGVVRQRETAVLAARSVMMALIRVTAPVFAACVTIFLGAVMLRGFGSLIEGLSPVATLTAAAAVAIVMINAIVADEGQPPTTLFAATSRLFGVLLLFLMALAAYGLFLRITGEGWTPNRIAATLIVGVVGLYAPIYAAAALTERWVVLRQGNILMSAVLVAVAVIIQTPLFKPYQWSAASQLALIEMADEPDAEDILYLRDRLGEQGQAAFARLQEGTGEAAELARTIGDTPSYELRLDNGGRVQSVTVGPEGAVMTDDIAAAVRQYGTYDGENHVIISDLPDVFWIVTYDNSSVDVIMLTRFAEGWMYDERQTLLLSAEDAEATFERIRAGGFRFASRTYRVLEIGDDSAPMGLSRYRALEMDAPLGEPVIPATPAVPEEEDLP